MFLSVPLTHSKLGKVRVVVNFEVAEVVWVSSLIITFKLRGIGRSFKNLCGVTFADGISAFMT